MRMFAQSIADTVNDTERRLIGARRAMDEALSATTGTVVETLEQTTGTITQAIQSSTNNVNDALYATNERFTSSLNQQTNQVHAALEENAHRISDVLASTAGNVTDVLNSTTGTLADTINDSSASVRNAIAANTGQFRQAMDETASQVNDRLGSFRGVADAEGRRANAALQEAQQQMVVEMQRAIEEATQRFNETAHAMRETAREVGGELEATRAELARGVNELPEETRASAAAMRRVVAEQIEALSELNAIVRSQPATHDINDRRQTQRPARPEPRNEAPAYQAPRQPEPARETYRAEPARQALVDPIRTLERAPEPVRQPELAPAPLRQPEPAQAAATAAEPEAASQGEGGWLRDVLRNATAKQQSTQQGQPGLSGLTEEIAHAIDDAALADAWARYQAGESNVFSRRIYTLAGQGTYDDVRKKMQREPDFARTANAYMSEFEQLLKRAAAGANPAAETRDQLLSDRGKVYTTLAHASGRLA